MFRQEQSETVLHHWKKTFPVVCFRADHLCEEVNSFQNSKINLSHLLLTGDVPAMSTPASRKLLKSFPNLLVALARSSVVPLEAWTTSLADWFRHAATSLS